MLIEFFVIGGMAFYVLLALIIILGFISLDNFTASVFLFIAASTTLILTSNVPLQWWYLPTWLAIGILWSFLRWVIFLRKGRQAFNDLDLSDNYTLAKAEREWGFTYSAGKLTSPIASKYTDRITSWILLWPLSIIWTSIGDGIIKGTKWCVRQLNQLYQHLSEYIYA